MYLVFALIAIAVSVGSYDRQEAVPPPPPPVQVTASAPSDYGTAVKPDPQKPISLQCDQSDLNRVPNSFYDSATGQHTVHFYGSALVPEALIVGTQPFHPDGDEPMPPPNPDRAVIIDPDLREAAAHGGLLLAEADFGGRIDRLTVCRIAI
jgi:hypothetical protein